VPVPESALPQETIRAKRDGGRLSEAQIAEFVAGIADGSVTEGQAAAFAMAVCLKGMATEERVALTRAMTRSGTVLDWSAKGLDGPVLDKHSTGGVGDKVSLILAPVIAACGGYVPMISGRGLGHTGGTLDKFDSIPGYDSTPDLDRLERVVREAGCAVVGATPEIAPADRRLYAIRDTTGTVESLDLITASILSKKLAAGLDALVLDVKTGSGAFFAAREDSLRLARCLVEVAVGAGLPTRALITDMNQVLGRTAGNAVEVEEAAAVLTGDAADARLVEVTLALAAELLALGGLARDAEAGRALAEAALDDGRAAARFDRMVAALGGPADFLATRRTHLPVADVRREVMPAAAGVVTAVDTRAVGLAVVALGGGRRAPDDRIDPSVGFSEIAGLGERVGPGIRPLAIVHARDETTAEAAADRLRTAVTLGESAPAQGPPVLETVAA